MKFLIAVCLAASILLVGCGSGDSASSATVPADQGTKMNKDTKTKGGPPGASQM